MLNYYFEYMIPLFYLGQELSNRGILVDQAELEKVKKDLTAQVEAKRLEFDALAPGVNPRSYLQMGTLFYEVLKFPTQYSPKTGHLSVDKDAIKALERIHGKHPVLKCLLELREVEKMKSTYADVVLDATGRLHTVYLVTGTETGRFSSKKAEDDEGLNMQNLPEWFRRVLIADIGKELEEGDESQAEARIVAYLAGEEEMIKVFDDPERNIHKLNASKIFGIPEDKIEKNNDPRAPYGMAKKCTHGWDYLLGDRHAARITGKPVKEMEKHRLAYFKAYPNIAKLQDNVAKIALGNKTLITPFGRRRMFLGRPPKITEEGVLIPDDDLIRKMIAYVPQSTCTEYIKRGMLRATGRLGKGFPTLPLGTELLMDNHDAFLLQCYPEQKEEVRDIMRRCTCLPLPITDIFGKTRELTIPLDFKTGRNWGEMK